MLRTMFVTAGLLLSTAAAAGPWLREPGQLFLSLSNIVRERASGAANELGLYAEYGYRPSLTLGIDYNERPGSVSHVLMFARWPLLQGDGPHRLAGEVAAGAHGWQGSWSPMYKLGLSYGRGFPIGQNHGWLAVDAAYEWRSGVPDPVYKLDLTAGQSTGGRVRPILQIETAYTSGLDLFWSVTPGVMIDGWQDGQTWLIGIERKHALVDSTGIKLALWHRF